MFAIIALMGISLQQQNESPESVLPRAAPTLERRLGSGELRQREPIHALACTVDGTRLLAGGLAGVLCTYDARSGARIACAELFKQPIDHLQVADDGGILVSAYLGGLARCDAGLRIESWRVQGELSLSLAVGAGVAALDKHRLAMTLVDGDNQAKAEFVMKTGGFVALAVAPAGDRCAVLSQRRDGGQLAGYVLVLAADGTVIANAREDGESFSSAAFSPDGEQLALGATDGAVWRLDLAPGDRAADDTARQLTRLRELHVGSIGAIAWSADGRSIGTGGNDRRVALIAADSGDLLWTAEAHQGAVSAVCFSPDSGRLFSGGQDRRIRAFSVADGADVLPAVGNLAPVSAVAWAAAAEVVASASIDGEVFVWDPAIEAPRFQVKLGPGHLAAVALSQDGALLAACGQGGGVAIVDVATRGPVRRLQDAGETCTCLAFSPTGTQVAAGATDGTVRIFDPTSGAVVARLSAGSAPVAAVAWSPAGDRLAVGAQALRLFDASSHQQTAELPAPFVRAGSLAFSGDGSRLVSTHADRVLRVWDVTRGVPAGEIKSAGGPFGDLAVSRDGRVAATCSATEPEVRLWTLDPPGVDQVFSAHEVGVLGVRFAADGARLVTGGRDATALVWRR